MAEIERNVFSRSPFISDNDNMVFEFVAEVMGELIALHPFREGNGRTAFIVANLVLMQNSMLPLDVFDRRSDQARYYAACEQVRVDRDYGPLANLIAEWERAGKAAWESANG